jgi:hypothetical protein
LTTAFLEALIDACVMESYFREHMAERDLLFHDAVAPHWERYERLRRRHERHGTRDRPTGIHNEGAKAMQSGDYENHKSSDKQIRWPNWA